MWLLGRTIGQPVACPEWQWTTQSHPAPSACLQVDPFPTGGMSCDHFGSPGQIDDPHTPTFGDTIEQMTGFEGAPKECALPAQRESGTRPKAGFFTIAHGLGSVRACLPDGTGCGPWRPVNH